MIPGRIKGANAKYLGTDERMGSLTVRKMQYLDGSIAMISAWHPTPEEIADITAGKAVYLEILSRYHPPVKLTTKDEWNP